MGPCVWWMCSNRGQSGLRRRRKAEETKTATVEEAFALPTTEEETTLKAKGAFSSSCFCFSRESLNSSSLRSNKKKAASTVRRKTKPTSTTWSRRIQKALYVTATCFVKCLGPVWRRRITGISRHQSLCLCIDKPLNINKSVQRKSSKRALLHL